MLKHLGQVNLGGLSFSIIKMGLQQDLTHWVVSELIRLCIEGNHGSAQREDSTATKSLLSSLNYRTTGEPLGARH